MHSQVSNSPAKQQPTSAEVLPFPVGALKVDRPTISRYASALFRNCTELQGWVSLRAFDHTTDKCVSSQWVRFGKGMVEAYEAAATTTANHSSPAVFAPPACIFLTNENAKAANIAAGPAIVVEIDERPQEASASLEIILGTPTMVIASGGTWTAPDGSAHDKRHLYWRLKKPATTPDALAKLTRVRKLATALASADPSNNPINHPIRCPGSWHTKTGAPRLCEIIGGDEGTEIDLDDALVKLERVAGGLLTDRQNSPGSAERDGFKTPREWSEQSLMKVAVQLPNKDRAWDDWNKIGMAIYDASHGSKAGREAFHTFSEKNEKYDVFLTDERWDHFGAHPPSDLSGGTLIFSMRQEVDPLWLPTWPREHDAETAEVFALAGNDGPLDIFASGDPARLSDLPANAVPPMLERVIRSEARRKGAPEAFATISTITAIGAAIGADVRVQVRQHDDTWNEATNLWSVVVADPGSAKSPIISAAVKPLKKVDAQWVRVDQAAYDKWYAASRKKGKDAPDPGPEPRIRRAIVDDVTSEKQIRIFRDNPRGVLRTPDELAGLLGGFGQYKSGGGADREHFLRSFDGDTITADRVGSGTITASRASLSVLASTQPDRLRDLVKNLGADGLLQRFLVVLHDGRDREGLDEEPDREAATWYENVIQRLTSAGDTFTDPLRLNPEAGKILAAAEKQIKLLRNIPGASTQLKGHIEKWGKLLPRLILIVHVTRKMEQHEGFDPSELIEPGTVAMAVCLASFFLDHALHFYATYFGAAEATSEARWIAEHLLAHSDVKVVSRKYLGDARKVYRGQDGQRLASKAMAELENFGWCWANEWDAGGPKSWCVDTRIHERFAEMAERVSQERKEKRQKIIASGNARTLLRAGMGASVSSSEGIFG